MIGSILPPLTMTPDAVTPAPRRNVALFVVLGLLVLAAGWAFTGYNSLVGSREDVSGAWAQVEAQYQRRFDAIPNLVNTVKGAANFEQETLTQVTQARTQWLSAGTRGERVEAAGEFQSALSRLLVTMEAYPQLKATDAFRDLMVQIEGTENRIQTARQDYNEAVRSYNVRVRRFPTNLLAGMFGFEPEEFFEADDGASSAPRVQFEDSSLAPASASSSR
jgi:LemA protein